MPYNDCCFGGSGASERCSGSSAAGRTGKWYDRPADAPDDMPFVNESRTCCQSCFRRYRKLTTAGEEKHTQQGRLDVGRSYLHMPLLAGVSKYVAPSRLGAVLRSRGFFWDPSVLTYLDDRSLSRAAAVCRRYRLRHGG